MAGEPRAPEAGDWFVPQLAELSCQSRMHALGASVGEGEDEDDQCGGKLHDAAVEEGMELTTAEESTYTYRPPPELLHPTTGAASAGNAESGRPHDDTAGLPFETYWTHDDGGGKAINGRTDTMIDHAHRGDRCSPTMEGACVRLDNLARPAASGGPLGGTMPLVLLAFLMGLLIATPHRWKPPLRRLLGPERFDAVDAAWSHATDGLVSTLLQSVRDVRLRLGSTLMALGQYAAAGAADDGGSTPLAPAAERGESREAGVAPMVPTRRPTAGPAATLRRGQWQMASNTEPREHEEDDEEDPGGPEEDLSGRERPGAAQAVDDSDQQRSGYGAAHLPPSAMPNAGPETDVEAAVDALRFAGRHQQGHSASADKPGGGIAPRHVPPVSRFGGAVLRDREQGASHGTSSEREQHAPEEGIGSAAAPPSEPPPIFYPCAGERRRRGPTQVGDPHTSDAGAGSAAHEDLGHASRSTASEVASERATTAPLRREYHLDE